MKRGTYVYIEQILREFPDSDKYINQRKEELRYPLEREADENIGGGRSNTVGSPTERAAISIADDKRLHKIIENKNAICSVLEDSSDLVNEIIHEFYFKKPRTKTWQGIAMEIPISERHCRRLRNMFFEQIADELGLPK
ncbi:hypothetical protein LZ578_08680 [Jeotgalibaca sp. MA1X17-3]|uniref:hypothetical protein n=1 Tax=Jeotgalibaca sp. MA1X17-3 TaxID=2908211 RepID=UPI001F3B6FC3|nr:hypothetical protein [Jeotgalibaca sp. MA1X17-3]UJF15073.1 hypothetical protein LZ578_08680 [Jeotgalibaca sp. MA1X17-3]